MKQETIMQNQIREALSPYGICLRMNTGTYYSQDGRPVKIGIKGMSDLLFVGQGYIAWLEVKTPTGRASTEQIRFIEEMNKLGHKAGVVRSTDEALALIGVI